MIYLLILAGWLGLASLFAFLYGLMWWLRERAMVREQRRRDLAHAARELASAPDAYRVIGGGCG